MGSVRSNSHWLTEFRTKYARWLPEGKPFLEAHRYAEAFKTYPWPTFTEAPWAAAQKALAQSRVAVVTTGGYYRKGVDAPFDEADPEGDWSYRALPRDVNQKGLGIAHPHFNHEVAEADMNTIFPIERLTELEREGVIGSLAPTHYSTMGYAPMAADLAEHTAPAIAEKMVAEGVDVALVIPV